MPDRVVKVVIRGDVSHLQRALDQAAGSTTRASAAMEGLSVSTNQNQAAQSRFVSGSTATNRSITTLGVSARDTDRSINQLTGRLSLMADAVAILGPGLVPIGAVAVPAVTGLANQLGVAAIAGGVAITAFQGVGDALEALNTYQLDPTAANLDAARDAMERLSPAAQELVQQVQNLRPELEGIRDASAEGLFPGVSDAIDRLDDRLPDVERIFSRIAEVSGQLAAEGGEAIASPRLDDFFDFLATDATDTLVDLGYTVGNVAEGLSELWMAFDPLNDDFSSWLLDGARSFNGWADGLAQTEGYADFVA